MRDPLVRYPGMYSHLVFEARLLFFHPGETSGVGECPSALWTGQGQVAALVLLERHPREATHPAQMSLWAPAGRHSSARLLPQLRHRPHYLQIPSPARARLLWELPRRRCPLVTYRWSVQRVRVGDWQQRRHLARALGHRLRREPERQPAR